MLYDKKYLFAINIKYNVIYILANVYLLYKFQLNKIIFNLSNTEFKVLVIMYGSVTTQNHNTKRFLFIVVILKLLIQILYNSKSQYKITEECLCETAPRVTTVLTLIMKVDSLWESEGGTGSSIQWSKKKSKKINSIQEAERVCLGKCTWQSLSSLDFPLKFCYSLHYLSLLTPYPHFYIGYKGFGN